MLKSASQWGSHSRTELTRYGTCASGKSSKANPKAVKTQCVFADGTSILVSNFLASFIRAGDDLLFSLELEAADSSTEIYIRSANPGAKRRDLFQTQIGYASRPRKDKRNNLFVSTEVSNPRLGVSAIYLPNEPLRDYFYVGNRHRAWDRQPSLYELLQVDRNASPADLRLAFKLRTLELRMAQSAHKNLAALVRCSLLAISHTTDRRFTLRESYRSSPSRNSNTSEHHCERLLFTTTAQSTEIRVENWKYSSTKRRCRCCGIRVGTRGSICWAPRSASRRPFYFSLI